MTASDRFGLILAAITIMGAVIGWLIRSVWNSQRQATDENTKALVRLTEAVGRLDSRISTIEGRAQRRR